MTEENLQLSLEGESVTKPKSKPRPKREIQVVGQEPPAKKAVAVRDYVVGHPEAKNKDVVTALAEVGVTVTPAYVSVVRGGSKKKGRVGRTAGSNRDLKDALRHERTLLQRRVEAIDTLLE